MPVRVIFRCDICGAQPDPETQASLEKQVLDLCHGEYVDAEPGHWLTWQRPRALRPQPLRLRQAPAGS